MKVLYNLCKILVYLSIVVLAVNTIGSFAHWLYLWGDQGVELPLAAWTAMKYWLIIGVVAMAVFVVAMTGGIMLEERYRSKKG